jgi:hypothetical protein
MAAIEIEAQVLNARMLHHMVPWRFAWPHIEAQIRKQAREIVASHAGSLLAEMFNGLVNSHELFSDDTARGVIKNNTVDHAKRERVPLCVAASCLEPGGRS